MKQIIALLLCLNIIIAPVCALDIADDFIESSLDKNLKIKPHKYIPIEDSFAQLNKNKNPNIRIVEYEEILPKTAGKKFIKKPVIIDENYKEVRIKIKQLYSTKSNLDEGDIIEFVTIDDIKVKNKFYPKNSTVKARIETISKNQTYGVPSDVIVSNFSLDNNILAGEISKTGANRSLWINPAIYATLWFFGAGLLLIPVRGGHAKIKPSEIYTLSITKE